jgi:hypothetical protein
VTSSKRGDCLPGRAGRSGQDIDHLLVDQPDRQPRLADCGDETPDKALFVRHRLQSCVMLVRFLLWLPVAIVIVLVLNLLGYGGYRLAMHLSRRFPLPVSLLIVIGLIWAVTIAWFLATTYR